MPRSYGLLFLACLAAFPIVVRAAKAEDVEQKAAVCTACHGDRGVPTDPTIPVIWGQNEGYIYLQLRDFKLGNRTNPLMSPIAQSLEKDDMRALAAYFAAKKWPDLRQPPASEEVAKHAEQVVNSAGCKACHLSHWQGDSTTPRVGGQSIGYLRATMAAFRDGGRTNNPWMAALLKTYSDVDIDVLARYLAGQ